MGTFVRSKVSIRAVFAGPCANHTIAIDDNAGAYLWGRNEDGQLGLGDTVNRYNRELVATTTLRPPSAFRIWS